MQNQQILDQNLDFNYDSQSNFEIKSYEGKLAQDQYLNQFFQNQVSPQQSLQNQNCFQSLTTFNAENHLTLQNLKQIQLEEEGFSSNNNIKASVFHNFQKHLIVTLKQIIPTEFIQEKLSKLSPLAVQIWKKFQSTKKYNKQILMLLFGTQHTQNKVKTKMRVFLNSGQQWPKTKIKVAQSLLRETVHQELKKKGQYCFLNRKIQGIEYFKIYVKQFMEELALGGIKKRLPKYQNIKQSKNK